MPRESVSMIEYQCGASSCGARRAVPEDYDGPPGWFVGQMGRVDDNGDVELTDVEACQPRHIRGAVEAATGNGGGGNGGEEGSAAEVADDPVDNDADDLDAEDAEDDDGEGLDDEPAIAGASRS